MVEMIIMQLKEDIRNWLVDYRFQIISKYRQLSELKEPFGLDETDVIGLLTNHLVLLYLDENPGPIFDVYELMGLEDVERVVYGTQAEIETIVEVNQQSAPDEDITSDLENSQGQSSNYKSFDERNL